jgi:hypothetical protein
MSRFGLTKKREAKASPFEGAVFSLCFSLFPEGMGVAGFTCVVCGDLLPQMRGSALFFGN